MAIQLPLILSTIGYNLKYRRLRPVTDKNIGKRYLKAGKRYYGNSEMALTEPIATVTRQQVRRQVIIRRKQLVRPWSKTGPAERLGGPSPKRPARPKHHRWLQA